MDHLRRFNLISWLLAILLLAASAAVATPPFPFKNGMQPPTPEKEALLSKKIVRLDTVQPNEFAYFRSYSDPGEMLGLPSSVKNLQYLPKVRSQGGQGSCAAWASCYYYKTYQEAKEHGWTRPDPSVDPQHVISPAFCYNLANDGVDEGSWPPTIMADVVGTHGAATWQQMPYNSANYTNWPAQDVWKDSLVYRGQSVGDISFNTDAGIAALKQHLANGDIAVFGMAIAANFYNYYPDDATGINNGVFFANSGGILGGHAMTIVGYDDNKSYNDGTGTKYGAFLVVNSWGSWGVYDSDMGSYGFLWIAYKYMRDSTGYGGHAYTMVDRTNYQPSVYASFGINHSMRSDLSVYFLGGNSSSSPDWSFSVLDRLGGNISINQKITVDISDFTPDLSKKVWLKVYDSASNAGTGQIFSMSVKQAAGAEKTSADVPKNTQNSAYAYVELPPSGDSTAPSVPQNLAASAVSPSQINLSWSASTDNVGVTGYRIYRNGSQISTTTAASFQNTGLTPSTAYSYTVAAYDAAGNASAQSVSASATTAPDTAAPSVPQNLQASAVSASQINLSWSASTDNVGVVGYRIYRNGSQFSTTTAASFQNTGLSPSTSYSYKVAAYDAAGNVSAQSAQASAATPSGPDTTAPSVPQNLQTLAVSTSQINLSWSASTDNVGVVGYRIYRGGTLLATTANTSYQNTGLSPSTAYSYTVAAYDAAGNASAQCAQASAATPAPDTTPPAVSFTSLSEDAVISGVVSISVSASDDKGVGRVEFYLDLVLKSTDTAAPYSFSFNSEQLTNGPHDVLAKAYDAAGNYTQASVSVMVSNAVYSGSPAETYVFPNPAKNGGTPVFHIETDPANVEVQIFDFTGRLVHKRTLAGDPKETTRDNKTAYAYEYEWDASNAASGAYFYLVTIETANGKSSRKGKFAIIR